MRFASIYVFVVNLRRWLVRVRRVVAVVTVPAALEVPVDRAARGSAAVAVVPVAFQVVVHLG